MGKKKKNASAALQQSLRNELIADVPNAPQPGVQRDAPQTAPKKPKLSKTKKKDRTERLERARAEGKIPYPSKGKNAPTTKNMPNDKNVLQTSGSTDGIDSVQMDAANDADEPSIIDALLEHLEQETAIKDRSSQGLVEDGGVRLDEGMPSVPPQQHQHQSFHQTPSRPNIGNGSWRQQDSWRPHESRSSVPSAQGVPYTQHLSSSTAYGQRHTMNVQPPRPAPLFADHSWDSHFPGRRENLSQSRHAFSTSNQIASDRYRPTYSQTTFDGPRDFHQSNQPYRAPLQLDRYVPNGYRPDRHAVANYTTNRYTADGSAPRQQVNTQQQRGRFATPEPQPLPVPQPTEAYIQRSLEKAERTSTVQPRLIIMDLNGTLVYRPSRKHSDRAIARPFVEPFLAHLLANYKVMIWTSARPDNMEKMCNKIFTSSQQKQLVAKWARDRFGLSTRQYNQKVQVYKQLSWVWADEDIQKSRPDYAIGGRWDQTNTFLLDDSFLKANAEPHNLILISEFTNTEQQKMADELSEIVGYIEESKYWTNVSSFARLMEFTHGGGWQHQWPQNEPVTEVEELARIEAGEGQSQDELLQSDDTQDELSQGFRRLQA